MKLKPVLLTLTASLGLWACSSSVSYTETDKGINVRLPEGNLTLIPLTDNSVRVKFFTEGETEVPEFILNGETDVPWFETEEVKGGLKLRLRSMAVELNYRSGSLSFLDAEGRVFLEEQAGSRVFLADTVQGEPCFVAEQSFVTGSDELILGLGQFQDGYFNLNGLSRRLTQVNSQISIPFIYSDKGYGLLWHQYGLTDFNPADNKIELALQHSDDAAEGQLAEVTTTHGTQRVSQDQRVYTGSFTVPREGEYSLFLDLGKMGNRHFVAVDDVPVLDISNMWLPPTAGTLVHLSKGEHEVTVICKADNEPSLFWDEKEELSTFRSPHARNLDYVVFYGPSADKVISTYRKLSGNAPMFPLWAYGFWQCRERYTSGTHLVETVKEFRKRDIPMDVIVQDWQYWGSKGWGVPEFDETHYPNPSAFIKEIHDLNAKLVVSIWSNPDLNSTLGKAYTEKGRFVPGTNWLDYFNPATREDYWNTLNDNMFSNGVDAWWMDAVEPENDALAGRMTYLGPGNFYRLTYPLMVSKAVYEGQRSATDDKRVCILTRSAFSGQQRYGVINWSGDIGGNWDGYKRQITAGLNFVMTGLPYWTTDIGGFFRPGPRQYTDDNYKELLVRWYQWGAFSPIFRMHGYMSETEPWKYGDEVEQAMRKMLELRYRLLPYIYSEAWKVTNMGSTMMRPLVMDFIGDKEASEQAYQYMFGSSFLVAPVTESGVDVVKVYLPESEGWYDFWTGTNYKGKQWVDVNVAFDRLPLFVKAGSIVPMGNHIQHTGKLPADVIELRIYDGADGCFVLYEDEGDGYGYEEGRYSTITFRWDSAKHSLTIDDTEGEHPGMLKERTFRIVLVSAKKGVGIEVSREVDKIISYDGKNQVVDFD
jgi:alpha-D-xyloside xylohydrolase